MKPESFKFFFMKNIKLFFFVLSSGLETSLPSFKTQTRLYSTPDDFTSKSYENLKLLKLAVLRHHIKCEIEVSSSIAGKFLVKFNMKEISQIVLNQPRILPPKKKESDFIDSLKKKYLSGLTKSDKLKLKEKIFQKRSFSRLKNLSPLPNKKLSIMEKLQSIRAMKKMEFERRASISIFGRDGYSIKQDLKLVKAIAFRDASKRIGFGFSWMIMIKLNLLFHRISKQCVKLKNIKSYRAMPQVIISLFLKMKVNAMKAFHKILAVEKITKMLKSSLPIINLNKKVVVVQNQVNFAFKLLRNFIKRYRKFKTSLLEKFMQALADCEKTCMIESNQREIFDEFFQVHQLSNMNQRNLPIFYEVTKDQMIDYLRKVYD